MARPARSPLFPRLTVLLLALSLGACGTATPQPSARAASPALDLPPMKVFPAAPPQPSHRSNATVARDFLELTFALENGTRLDRFTRFEGPITLRVTGAQIPVSLGPDLAHLLSRLDREAGITITRVPPSEPAAITIQTLRHEDLSRRAPNTACIVAPNVSDWSEFRHTRRQKLSWTTVETRERLAIFIPEDVAPQEIRDCLHEELAQALGPLNDLYRLPDSVFNDDNVHSVLTPFDMLVLRVTYAPELHSGMSPEEVAARLPGILARVHPEGGPARPAPPSPTPRLWIDSVTAAMGAGELSERSMAAQVAVSIAREQGWEDTRAGFSWFLLGRLAMASDRRLARAALEEAGRIYALSPDTRFHAGHVALQLAALALSDGNYTRAEQLAASAVPAARDAENAALLASLLLTQAAALDQLGRPGEARAVRLDSLGWARYGFGSDTTVQDRVAEISALTGRS
ncbi:DUF2927 domain-containing protein [Celeribacter indicus]|uniref:ATP-dependent transcriptional regulator n=1 Tax=Celeribacter indicus TaxID=1208324 RepID=A0A0B5E3J3_9RHOB|nr:DUF2927 domain-containing protein [Celeribacter indicus]AJE47646.1 hypothetical protein P73_2931 [Celeribacter indicus]SDW13041.1 Protein of unknown function [Celeribacter indicus]